jgi:hypothetical protein
MINTRLFTPSKRLASSKSPAAPSTASAVVVSPSLFRLANAVRICPALLCPKLTRSLVLFSPCCVRRQAWSRRAAFPLVGDGPYIEVHQKTPLGFDCNARVSKSFSWLGQGSPRAGIRRVMRERARHGAELSIAIDHNFCRNGPANRYRDDLSRPRRAQLGRRRKSGAYRPASRPRRPSDLTPMAHMSCARSAAN